MTGPMRISPSVGLAGIVTVIAVRRDRGRAFPREGERISAEFHLRRPVPSFWARNEQLRRTTAAAGLTCRRGLFSDFAFDAGNDPPKPLLPLHSQRGLQAEMPDHVVRDIRDLFG